MRKILKNTNTTYKSVNNLSIKTHHFFASRHIMSKGFQEAIESLKPIYEELDEDYSTVDMVDLIFYERWLNERY